MNNFKEALEKLEKTLADTGILSELEAAFRSTAPDVNAVIPDLETRLRTAIRERNEESAKLRTCEEQLALAYVDISKGDQHIRELEAEAEDAREAFKTSLAFKQKQLEALQAAQLNSMSEGIVVHSQAALIEQLQAENLKYQRAVENLKHALA